MSTSRLSMIAHAATVAQRLAAFPLDEPILDEPILGEHIPDQEISRATALKLQARNGQIWSAPEQRAQQTARLLGVPATPAEDLRECSYGRWAGRRMDAVHAEDPEGILTWLTDPGAAPHGGESIEVLVSRIGAWMEERRDAQRTVAITHPGVIRAAIVHALQVPPNAFWRIDIAPFTVTELRWNQHRWTVRSTGCPLAISGL